MTDTTDDAPRVDMTNAENLLTEIRGMLDKLDGSYGVNAEADNNKKRMRYSAMMSQNLLYSAHLADSLRLEVMNEYHRFKGHDAPRVEL
jgi:hypothetical protein